MNDYSNDDEQVAALKKWWKENGNSLLIGIGLALAIVFGWKAYEKHTKESAEAASNRYQALLQSMLALDEEQQEEEALSKVQLQAHEVKKEHANSVYAQYAAMILAKLAVQEGNFKQAEEELRWILEQKPQEETKRLVTSRLARVLIAQERYDDALALLSVPKDDAFFTYFQELKGDVLLQAGKEEEAREAYQTALDHAKEDGRELPLLEIKLADIATKS